MYNSVKNSLTCADGIADCTSTQISYFIGTEAAVKFLQRNTIDGTLTNFEDANLCHYVANHANESNFLLFFWYLIDVSMHKKENYQEDELVNVVCWVSV